MSEDKKELVDVRDLQFYFDAQERDCVDRQGYSRRTSEVLTIRDRLLALPERDFDSMVQTIKNMLNPGPSDNSKQESKPKRKEASELYEQLSAERPASPSKSNPV